MGFGKVRYRSRKPLGDRSRAHAAPRIRGGAGGGRLEVTRGRHLAIEHTKPVFRKIHTKATVFRSIAKCLPLVYETALHIYRRPAKQLSASLSATGGENRKTIRFLFSPFLADDAEFGRRVTVHDDSGALAHPWLRLVIRTIYLLYVG